MQHHRVRIWHLTVQLSLKTSGPGHAVHVISNQMWKTLGHLTAGLLPWQSSKNLLLFRQKPLSLMKACSFVRVCARNELLYTDRCTYLAQQSPLLLVGWIALVQDHAHRQHGNRQSDDARPASATTKCDSSLHCNPVPTSEALHLLRKRLLHGMQRL